MCRLCGSVAPNGRTATSHFCERRNAWFCSARIHSRGMGRGSPHTSQILKENKKRAWSMSEECFADASGSSTSVSCTLRQDNLPNLHRRVGLAMALEPAVVFAAAEVLDVQLGGRVI